MRDVDLEHSEGILFMMHCPSNTGYAIGNLEETFYKAAVKAGFGRQRIFFTYPSISAGRPSWMDQDVDIKYFVYDRSQNTASAHAFIRKLVRQNNIRIAFAFDLQPNNPVNRTLRLAGVRNLISYWGAPMSALNRGVKLVLKRIEVALRRSGPDLYIFESEAMKQLAVHGRGVARGRCVVIPTGVDTTRFYPSTQPMSVVHEALDIPADRKLLVYTGHMEERKGVHVIVKAMDLLVGQHGRSDVQFLAYGNRPGEEQRFYDMLEHPQTRNFITFGGYRKDVEVVFREAFAGVVASTGWDSWPMSVIEMAASGLPLLVSDLQGLKEFVSHGEHGYRFPPGDYTSLARSISSLADHPASAKSMGSACRAKVEQLYSRQLQLDRLAALLTPISLPDGPHRP